jgi:hypothetical protein
MQQGKAPCPVGEKRWWWRQRSRVHCDVCEGQRVAGGARRLSGELLQPTGNGDCLPEFTIAQFSMKKTITNENPTAFVHAWLYGTVLDIIADVD